MKDIKTQKSIYISLLLRHKPEEGNLTLDQHGWCDINKLIEAVKNKFKEFSLEELDDIVATDNKQRYSYNESKTKIRANQGHSINVDVEMSEIIPPDILYHGTATKVINSIKKEGIKTMSRLHVHLTTDYNEALSSGKRHGSPIVLIIDAKKMYEDGYKFYLSANNRYLSKDIPPQYLSF